MSEKAHEKEEGHGGGGGPQKGGGGHGGGGHEEAHEGAPEWLISFADNVALMMGFFVVLLAMNMAKPTAGGIGGEAAMGGSPSIEMMDFALAMREAFNNPVDINSSNPQEQSLVQRLIERRGASETRDPGIKGHKQDVQSTRQTDYFAVCGSVPFSDASSEVTATGRAVIAEAAKKVRGVRFVVEVRGHSSSAEAVRGASIAMKLSSDRALAVADALAAMGVDWWQMRLVVCGDHDRVEAFPTNQKADRANARVEVVITDEVVPDRVPTRSGSAGPVAATQEHASEPTAHASHGESPAPSTDH
jgi:flagellar motor protein MotB